MSALQLWTKPKMKKKYESRETNLKDFNSGERHKREREWDFREKRRGQITKKHM